MHTTEHVSIAINPRVHVHSAPSGLRKLLQGQKIIEKQSLSKSIH
jgi:hypothetical protein